MEDALVRVVDLCKVYNPGENEVRALDHVNLEIHKGEFVAIIGQSGSGKVLQSLDCSLNSLPRQDARSRIEIMNCFHTHLSFIYLPPFTTELRPSYILQI